MIIRSAKPEDASELARINIASWHSTYRGLIADETLDAMKSEDYLKKWNNILSLSNDSSCFVAEHKSGEVIGYSVAGKNRREKFPFGGELFAIYLLKEHQGKGIGKKLFLRSVEEFQKRSINSFLLFVLSANSDSRKFYETFKPDFTGVENLTIDKREYEHTCYGWSRLLNLLNP